MILGPAARGALDQLRLDEFLAHHPLDRPAQSFDCPVVTFSIEDPNDIVPTMLWA
uniref:Resolvase domain protein n=1 Tax=Rhizobium rhizogenes TaxID=359 RepID=A0A7S4ZSM4_RHIRH|nr:resolvase domain protein [Rhizobium rhizogenes]